MSEDRIERETLIAASLERVWALVNEPGFWVIENPGAEARVGETTQSTHPEYGTFPVRVEKVEPMTYIAYRWASAFSGADLTDDNSTLVEFTLSTEGDRTRLRVVESGFASLVGDEELRAKAHSDNSGGWTEVLAAFTKRAEQPAA
jgi:uncharacterized protein YndB with AHSA1/START domain